MQRATSTSRQGVYANNIELVSRKKLVVVGDGSCGKTCMLVAYTKNEFLEKYIPTIFESLIADIRVDERTMVQMALWDTAGQEDYELLRPLSYPNTDVILVCFSVNSRDSFENVYQKWIPEVKHHCPNTPIILVGTKIDLRPANNSDIHNTNNRNDENKRDNKNAGVSLKGRHAVINQADGVKLAKTIQAECYIECSSKTRQGISGLFEMAARVALGLTNKVNKKHKNPTCCSIV